MNNAQYDRYAATTLATIKRVASATWPFAILCLINYATFAAHYDGRATFPWDFLGGYHAQSFGWYNEGGMFNPPSWFPWTNLGFPAFLALQSGAWYLPLQLMHTLGIAYTIHAATVFQVLHVLFGAVGVYLLTRRLGASKAIALMMAIGFHFSVAFYSNQQNVDIVRATAFIPWLLLVLYPSKERGARWRVLAGAFVLSQFLIAGYPGNIVSAAYACLIWVAFHAWKSVSSTTRMEYLVEVTLIVTAGTLISMLKWLPVIINGSAGISIQHLPPMPFSLSHLLTLMTPYTNDALPGDITMRSLWLPLTCIWGAFYASTKEKLTQIGLLLMALAFVMGVFVRSNSFLASVMPGMQLSRFPLADWRPILQIGIIILGISGWTAFLTKNNHSTRMLYGSISAFVLGTTIIIAAILVGFSAHEMLRVIIANATLATITLLYSTTCRNTAHTKLLSVATTLALVIFTMVGGYQYQKSQQATWHPEWSRAIERQIFGTDIKSMIVSPRPTGEMARRPSRMLIGSNPKEALAKQDSSLYNKCWYERMFCVFGYDNLKMSAPHKMFLSSLSKPDGVGLLNFAEAPQQLLALRRGDNNVMAALAAVPVNDDAPVVGDATGIVLDFLEYAPNFVQYQVSTPRDVQFVENEMWWPGWKISICTDGGSCSAYANTRSTPQGLRTWALKTGGWIVNLRYFGPSPMPGYICALGGLLLAFGTLVTSASPKRRRNEPSTS